MVTGELSLIGIRLSKNSLLLCNFVDFSSASTTPQVKPRIPRTSSANPTGLSQILTVDSQPPRPPSLLLSARSFPVKGCQACKALLPQRETEAIIFLTATLSVIQHAHKSPLQHLKFLRHLPDLIFGINTEKSRCNLHLHFRPPTK